MGRKSRSLESTRIFYKLISQVFRNTSKKKIKEKDGGMKKKSNG